MTGMYKALALLAAFALALATTGCEGSDEAPRDTIVKAGASTSKWRTTRVAVTGWIEGGGRPGRLTYAANGRLDYARRRGHLRLEPLKLSRSARVTTTDVRGEVILAQRAVYLRSPALARGFALERPRWLRIALGGTIEQKGIDFRPIAELINATGALHHLRTARGKVERLGEERVGGRNTSHYRTRVNRGSPRRPLPASADIWIDEDGFVRRLEERYRWGPPSFGLRGRQRIEFLAFGVPVEASTPADSAAIGATAPSVRDGLRKRDRKLPEREQAKAVVLGFFEDIARDDVRAACDKLSPGGRGVAIATVTYPGRPIPPATREQCVEDGLRGLRNNPSLPFVLKGGGLRISSVHVSGRRASVVVSAGAIDGVQRLSKTSEGWKIDRYENPVRD